MFPRVRRNASSKVTFNSKNEQGPGLPPVRFRFQLLFVFPINRRTATKLHGHMKRPGHIAETFCLDDSRIHFPPPRSQRDIHPCLMSYHRVLVLGASPKQNAVSCAIWGCFCFWQITYQGQVYPDRRAHWETDSQFFLGFFFFLPQMFL